MLKAIIQHGDDTVITQLPCDRMQLAQQRASIGISSPAHQIRCEDEDANPIKVKIIGESEFENKLASLFSSEHTLSFANTVCEIYQSLPYQNKLDAMEVLLKGRVESVGEFSRTSFSIKSKKNRQKPVGTASACCFIDLLAELIHRFWRLCLIKERSTRSINREDTGYQCEGGEILGKFSCKFFHFKLAPFNIFALIAEIAAEIVPKP